MNFGKNIKHLRLEANMTQEQVAEKLGMRQSSYVSWEQKADNPTLTLLKKLSTLYQCPIERIIEKEDSKETEKILLTHFRELGAENQQQLSDFARFLLEQNVLQTASNEKENSKVRQLTNYKRKALNYAVVEDELLSAGYGQAVSNSGEKYKAYTTERLGRYDGAARINGNSMEPDFPNFSIATFLNTGFEQNGKIYAISEGDLGEEQLYIKQVFLEKEGFRIHSLNPKYRDFYLTNGDNFRIIGPVVDNFVEIEEDQIEDD